MNVHDIVANAVARAQQGALRSAQAVGFDYGYDTDAEHEKTASAEEADDQSEYREKLASALDELADMMVGNSTKLAAHVGGGDKGKETLGGNVKGKPMFTTGKAKLQPTQSPLQSTKGGAGRTALKTETGHYLDSKNKTAASDELRERIKQKLASMNGNEANITQTPLRSPGGESFGGTGPGVRAPGTELISSNERARDFKPREAKVHALAGLKAFLNEPAFSRTTDPVLHESFQNASKAGVKIAGLSAKDKLRNTLLGVN